MGAGAITICHNEAAVQVKEDMKKMVQFPMHKPFPATTTRGKKIFGVSLLELKDLGLVKDGVPVVVRSMVEYLEKHGLHQEGLFRVNGSVRTVDNLRRRFDGGEDVDLCEEADAFAVASLMKQFLRDLPEGLIHPSIHSPLIQLYQESSEDDFCKGLHELLQQLPKIHYCLLHYLCHFLSHVEQEHAHNRMTATNLATVFGPNVFHVSSGFGGIQEQKICNNIMAKLIQNYSALFESVAERRQSKEEPSNIIMVKEANTNTANTAMSPYPPVPKAHIPDLKKIKVGVAQCTPVENTDSPRERESSPDKPKTKARKKKVTHCTPVKDTDPLRESESSPDNPSTTPRKKKVKKVKTEVASRSVPQPTPSGVPQSRPLPHLSDRSSGSRAQFSLYPPDRSSSPSSDCMNLTPHILTPTMSTDTFNSSLEDERPISPFYISSQISSGHCRPDLTHILEKTIRSAVEQHLFNRNMHTGQSSEGLDPTAHPLSPVTTARERRRHQREQEGKENYRVKGDKENIQSPGVRVTEEGESRLLLALEGQRNRKPKHNPTLTELSDNQDASTPMECQGSSEEYGRSSRENAVSSSSRENHEKETEYRSLQTPAMKIQEVLNGAETCDDVPRLDLSTLTEDNNWADSCVFSAPFLDFKSLFHQSYNEEPVPAYSSWQRESMDREEARLSPHAGGKPIRQLLEEDSDPMVSPRFYAYGDSQQYLDDTEVPPSPPNAHSFVSRRRSSSLGSCDDDREELTSAQLSKRIHVLKKKIRRFEEKFEEERKYRPSHGDKAANPEVLRWMNELTKMRKDFKDHKLLKSEEDLTPIPRQRSNTLPKSFGSQLEKKPIETKAPKPPVESTMEAVMNKLQEKRKEVGRPEDIKDMTREQIGAEKVALQKGLLYYESIHGRPVTKNERQVMKPLYDRYRLVKQILCRASAIPVIGSPSSKRRGPLLQPIIEGVPALFFSDTKEEEDGSDEDNDTTTQFTVTVKPELSMLGFLDQLEEDADGFISPVDELSPSKNTTDMRLSNLHAATMQELVEQLQEAREEKKRIRKNLREFEDEFFKQNGRNIQKEDRTPLAGEYNEYKHIKAKLRLLEVLISKRDSSKFI
ncbi:protein FAM13A-like isoform X2 [Myxocyprinus asiaticus]|uniref:protein FAM13A-like isoform X2 n=1 Tax=Myxocyprinus asiaticus TaxID=70543 RepID=UPI0022230F4D|nr:protein FAM13A-like isoform X2 [Myxocyprinus asiaticus]